MDSRAAIDRQSCASLSQPPAARKLLGHHERYSAPPCAVQRTAIRLTIGLAAGRLPAGAAKFGLAIPTVLINSRRISKGMPQAKMTPRCAAGNLPATGRSDAARCATLYDLGDRLLLVATDRISAFDWVLPTGIPDKGRVLTQLSAFWFDRLGEAQSPAHRPTWPRWTCRAGIDREPLAGRTMLVRKTEVVPIECVVRGYLSGSGWKEYQQHGTVCGMRLPAGLARKRSAARADLHAGHQGGKRPR